MTPRHEIAIDIETFSEVDLKKAGVYKYAAHPSFEILIIAYKIDNEPTRLLPLDNFLDADELVEYEMFLSALTDPAYLKTAFNAPFERECLRQHFKDIKIQLPADQWACTLAKAYTCGMAGGLDQVAGILRLGEKMKEGYNLIRYFCVPCKPTKVNGGRTRNLPHHDPAKWEAFQQYCIKDVDLEHAIRTKLKSFQQPDFERRLWILDQKINDRGVKVDQHFVQNAIAIDSARADVLLQQATELTGLANAKSVAQLKKWIEAEIGEEIEGLGKDKLPALLKKVTQENVQQLIALRQQMAKTSTKKYVKMLDCMTADGYLRGMLQYYGASRTGRWAGRLVQLHNLPKTQIEDLAYPSRSVGLSKDHDELSLARRLVAAGDAETLDLLFHSVPEVLSMLIRTAFIPEKGKRFIISDFSAIEARVIAWLAGEKWRLEIFRNKGKIYEASAAAMFKVPIESITKTSPMRQRGKISELSLGFGGGSGALARMEISNKIPEKDRIPEAEKDIIKEAWRHASPRICGLWYAAEEAARTAIENPGQVVQIDSIVPDWNKYAAGLHIKAPVFFHVKNNVLFMRLPSGRQLCYLRPGFAEGKYGPVITYEGVDQDTKKWGRQETYGGKLTENMVQAIARDLLAFAMLNADEAAYDIALHVHDEIVSEMYDAYGSVKEINEIMSRLPDWAEGLPLSAESFESDYYKKD